jgi:L-methionine (R)-S-oxide reductase
MELQESARHDFIENLVSVSAFVEERSNLDNSLTEFAALVAKTLNTANCSIMLLKENQQQGTPQETGVRELGVQELGVQELRVQAHHGNLPPAAYATAIQLDQGIAGKVARTGKPMLVEDIATLDSTGPIKRSSNIPGGFISVPIIMDGSVIGVINVNSPLDGRVFQQRDLQLANILGLFIAKSIQTLHLKNLLQSRFAIAALSQGNNGAERRDPAATAKPDQLVKILAKSFYLNLRQLGLGDDHILKTTTEIIDLLLHKDEQA